MNPSTSVSLALLVLVAVALVAVVVAIVLLTRSGRTVDFPGLRSRTRFQTLSRGDPASRL
jgi:hypothetical protein